MAASANMGPKHMMFEPVHGSAPKYTGQNVVNPIAMLQSVQLMFEALAYRKKDQSWISVRISYNKQFSNTSRKAELSPMTSVVMLAPQMLAKLLLIDVKP